MMLAIYGIVSGTIAVISIAILGYRVEYYDMRDSAIGDEIGLALACIFFWPIIGPIVGIWGGGHLLARRQKRLAAEVVAHNSDPNKYRQ